MTENKSSALTDAEIIKALEEIADFDCNRCSFDNENCSGEECEVVICRNALALINRLQADKEALFAEKLKKDYVPNFAEQIIFSIAIDNLIKETAGDAE